MGYGDTLFLNKRGVTKPTPGVNNAAPAAQPAPVQNNAIGSSPAAVAAMIANTPSVLPGAAKPTINTETIQPGTGTGYIPPSFPSSGGTVTVQTAPPPTPVVLQWERQKTFQPGVKQAEPDIVLNPEIDTTGDYIAERFFQELGGTELISLSRHDLIDGIDVSYNPIANLSRLRQEFNPNNIISLDILSQNEFAQSTINLLSRGIYEPYLDENGNLIVEVDIIKPEENINIQIAEIGTITRIEL